MPQPGRRISFAGSQGASLAARLDLPDGPVHRHAVFAHCFTCSKDIRAAGRIAARLNADGIAVLRFDFTGLGASEGEFANTNFSSNVEDLRRAADWLRSEHAAPQLLVGHSLGGAAAIVAASDIPEVRAVATIAAPSSTQHLSELLGEQLRDVEADAVVPLRIGGREFMVRGAFLSDLSAHAVEERARSMSAALLVLHSPVDNVVGVEHAGRLFAAARHPKSFVALDGADHLLSDDRDAIYAGDVIGTWAKRYLEETGEP